MFSTPFPGAFGLDIGDLSIKLVQLKNKSFFHHKPHYELHIARSIDLPAGLIVNGEMQKPEEVRQRIMHLLRGTKKQKPVKGPWVVACVPECKSFIKLIQIPAATEDILDEDIINLAKKHIPFDNPDDYYFQWQFIPNNLIKTTQVLIGAVAKNTADNLTYLLESMGLGVVALEIEAISLARSMITARKEYVNEDRAILDLGATRSSLIIFDGDIIQFSTSIPYSGELITTALMQKMHLSYEEAEKIKQGQGLSYEKNKNKILEIMIDMNNKLVESIEDSLQFYYSHFEHSDKIKKIIMCGGGANLNRLDKYLSSQLKIIARPGQPWKNLSSKKATGIDEKESLKFATAIGLALRAADNPYFTNDVV